MTVTVNQNSQTRAGNGVATSFSFSPVRIYSADQLRVYLINPSGVVTEIFSPDFTVDITSDGFQAVTGSVIYPADLVTPLPSGWSIRMDRNLPYLQDRIDLENQGGYDSELVESQFDYVTYLTQQIVADLATAVKVPVGSSIDPNDLLDEFLAATVNIEDFNTRYLGAKAADPATDNSGDPLTTGALYFNTGLAQLKVYDGASWVGFGANTDELASISAADTTAGYLEDKLLVGQETVKTKQNPGGNETLTFSLSQNAINSTRLYMYSNY